MATGGYFFMATDNAVKHLRLNEEGFLSGQPGEYAEITEQSQFATFPMRFPFHFAANHWVIRTPDNPTGPSATHDAFHLVHQAIADWDTWLDNHGESLPSP